MLVSSSGRTRQRVTVDGPTGSPTAEGGYTETWTPLAPPDWYCEILAVGPTDERAVAGTVSATATHELRGRFHPGIDIRTRITFVDGHHGGTTRTFAVESVRNREERGAELSIIAHEVLP